MPGLLTIGFFTGAAFSLVFSAVVLRLGVMIDRFPLENEGKRDMSMWSPAAFTRISVIVYWPLYIFGGWMAFQPGRFMLIGGLVLLFAVFFFLLTAMMFSIGVYNLMLSKNRDAGMPSIMESLVEWFRNACTGRLRPSVRASGKL